MGCDPIAFTGWSCFATEVLNAHLDVWENREAAQSLADSFSYFGLVKFLGKYTIYEAKMLEQWINYV